jgi:hypothetical protein
MKLTPWFDGKTQKPARRGVYMLMSGPKIGFQKWDGIAWGSWYETVDAAARTPKHDYANAVYQSDNWRGLAQKTPNVQFTGCPQGSPSATAG